MVGEVMPKHAGLTDDVVHERSEEVDAALRAVHLRRKPLSRTQILMLKAVAVGKEIVVCPPAAMGFTRDYGWRTFVALNNRGYVWAGPVAEERPQTPPGYFYSGGGKGRFHQTVRLTALGRECLSGTSEGL